MNVSLDEAIGAAEMRPAAYVLLGSDCKYKYKGSCRSLRHRLEDHRAGRAARTKNRRPLKLVHFEYFATYAEALSREKYLKTHFGRIWLDRLLRKTMGDSGGQTVPLAPR